MYQNRLILEFIVIEYVKFDTFFWLIESGSLFFFFKSCHIGGHLREGGMRILKSRPQHKNDRKTLLYTNAKYVKNSVNIKSNILYFLLNFFTKIRQTSECSSFLTSESTPRSTILFIAVGLS